MANFMVTAIYLQTVKALDHGPIINKKGSLQAYK